MSLRTIDNLTYTKDYACIGVIMVLLCKVIMFFTIKYFKMRHLLVCGLNSVFWQDYVLTRLGLGGERERRKKSDQAWVLSKTAHFTWVCTLQCARYARNIQNWPVIGFSTTEKERGGLASPIFDYAGGVRGTHKSKCAHYGSAAKRVRNKACWCPAMLQSIR